MENKMILEKWCKFHVQQDIINSRISLTDIYSKFIFDHQKLDEINRSKFSLLFKKYLRDNNFIFQVIQSGSEPFYFGLKIRGVKQSFQYFDLTNQKTNTSLSFNMFTKEKVVNWISNCIVINTTTSKCITKEHVATEELFLNYCFYYNIDVPKTDYNLIRFGMLLAQVIKEDKIPLFNSRDKVFKAKKGDFNIIKLNYVKSTISNT